MFWEFNDRRMRVVSSTPSLSAPYWMGCPTGMQTVQEDHLRPGEGRFEVVNTESIDTNHNAVSCLRPSKVLLIFVALSSLLFLVND